MSSYSNTEEFDKWENMPDLNMDLLRGIYSYGFQNPSPIQQKAIIPILSKQHLIAQAQSGTGKTGAFSIGVLNTVKTQNDNIQAVVMSPTRELSIQTYNVMEQIGQYMNVRIKLLIGGSPTEHDLKEIRTNKPHIIVGCPGRFFDVFKRERILLERECLLVIDEADEMLSYAFKEHMYTLHGMLGKPQIALFSATVSEEMKEFSKNLMPNPIEILVKSEMLTLEGITQHYIALQNDNEKYDTLKDIYSAITKGQCIIYCNSVKRVADLCEALRSEEYPVTCMHSNMNKEERKEAYTDFKNGKFRLMISSNVTARGIDIQQVSTVINFDIPKDVHTYLHRIGRSGRWGRKGVGISFITRRDIRLVKDIERYYNTEIKELPQSFVE